MTTTCRLSCSTSEWAASKTYSTKVETVGTADEAVPPLAFGFQVSFFMMYTILEHTADKGIEAICPTLESLFEVAAEGLFALMIEPSETPASHTETIEVHAHDLEGLMIRWLNELLYHFEVHHRLFHQFEALELKQGETCLLRAAVRGTVVEPVEIEWRGAPVKAATYHQLKIEPRVNAWYLRYYVDV